MISHSDGENPAIPAGDPKPGQNSPLLGAKQALQLPSLLVPDLHHELATPPKIDFPSSIFVFDVL